MLVQDYASNSATLWLAQRQHLTQLNSRLLLPLGTTGSPHLPHPSIRLARLREDQTAIFAAAAAAWLLLLTTCTVCELCVCVCVCGGGRSVAAIRPPNMAHAHIHTTYMHTVHTRIRTRQTPCACALPSLSLAPWALLPVPPPGRAPCFAFALGHGLSWAMAWSSLGSWELAVFGVRVCDTWSLNMGFAFYRRYYRLSAVQCIYEFTSAEPV